MWFHLVLIALSTSLLFQGVAGHVTPNQVVVNIKTVTKASGNLNVALGGLTTTKPIAEVAVVAKVVVEGFATIVKDVAGAVTMMQGTAPFGDVDATLVVDTLVAFVRVHQALLVTVIGKHSIFAQFGLTAPVTAVLRTLEAGVDAFAFALIALIPTKKKSVQTSIGGLDSSVKNCINTYSQLCVPSILYPSIMPICIAI